MKRSLVVGSIVAALLGLSAPRAEAKMQCLFITALLSDYLPAVSSGKWRAFQLKTNGEVKHIAFLYESEPGKPFTRWVVTTLSSPSSPGTFCIESQGQLVERMASLHDTYQGKEKYGLPGSGYPRCALKRDPLGGLKVRGWASRELGKGLILALGKPENGKSFIMLTNPVDGHWILLHNGPAEPTCYRSRGEVYDSRVLQVNR